MTPEVIAILKHIETSLAVIAIFCALDYFFKGWKR